MMHTCILLMQFSEYHTYIYIEEQIVETDRTEWKTLSGNRA